MPKFDYGPLEVRGPINIAVDDVIPEKYRPIKRAVATTVNIPLNGAWTGNNNLGFITNFQPDANWDQVILKLPEWGMPEIWTLMLGLDYERRAWPMAAPHYYFEIKALLSVGCGGTSVDMEMDWKRGACISLPLNALSVKAHYSFPAGTPSFPPNLRLSAHVSHGPIQKPWQATNTQRMLETAADPNSLYVPVPLFAHTVLLFPENLALAPVGNLLYSSDTIIGWGSGAGASSFYMIYYITGDMLASYPTGLPVPSGCETLIVYNPAGADQVRSTAIFNLCG